MQELPATTHDPEHIHSQQGEPAGLAPRATNWAVSSTAVWREHMQLWSTHPLGQGSSDSWAAHVSACSLLGLARLDISSAQRSTTSRMSTRQTNKSVEGDACQGATFYRLYAEKRIFGIVVLENCCFFNGCCHAKPLA